MKGKNYYVEKVRKAGKKFIQDETDNAQLSSPVASGVQDQEVPPTSNGQVAWRLFVGKTAKEPITLFCREIRFPESFG